MSEPRIPRTARVPVWDAGREAVLCAHAGRSLAMGELRLTTGALLALCRLGVEDDGRLKLERLWLQGRIGAGDWAYLVAAGLAEQRGQSGEITDAGNALLRSVVAFVNEGGGLEG